MEDKDQSNNNHVSKNESMEVEAAESAERSGLAAREFLDSFVLFISTIGEKFAYFNLIILFDHAVYNDNIIGLCSSSVMK
jgi:hypothetical protein